MAKLYFHWIAAIPLNGSISLTFTDSADIKVTAFSAPYIESFRPQIIDDYTREMRKVEKERAGWARGRGNKLQKNGGKDSRDDRGRPEGRYKSAIPSLTFWQALSKLNFRIWKKGSAVCLRVPRLGSFVIYVRDVRPAGAIVDIQ